MPKDDDQPEVIKVTETLSEKVQRLIDTVTISTRQLLFLKIGGVVLAGVIALMLLGGVWLWTVAQDAKEATEANERTAVVNCQNANESRRAQVVLWDFILAASGRDDEEPRTAEEEQFREEFRDWIHALYAERDCQNLDKKYKLPDPPSISGETTQSS